jgi:hypothetical protein
MIFWSLAGLLVALVTACLVTPLYKTHKVIAFGLIFLIPTVSFSLYWLYGNPDLIP